MFHYVTGFDVVNPGTTQRLQSAFQDHSLSRLEVEGVIFDEESNVYLNQQLANKRLEAIVFRNCQYPRIDYWAEVQALTLQGSQPNGQIAIGDQLVELNLTSISLSEDLAASLGRQIGTHVTLQRLDCSESRFLEDGPRFLAHGLARNQTLEVVNFSECNFMDESLAQLVHALRQNPSLTTLDISFNKCRSMGVEALAHLVAHNESLRELSMGFQAFGESKRMELQPLFLGLTNSKLQRLEIGGNSICDDDMPQLVDMLGQNKSLTSLDLSGNRISDNGIQVLASRLKEIGLRHLALEENGLGSSSLGHLARSLKSNLSLQDLELDQELISLDHAGIQHAWKQITYHLDLNWGGRRIVQQQSTVSASIWPVLLARSNRAQEWNLARDVKQQDIAYFILQEIANLLV